MKTEMELNGGTVAAPTAEAQRHAVLDVLRGLALMGIALANFPEFGLWSFLTEAHRAALPWAEADVAVRFVQYVLVDAKFYTVFSLLFGIGFSIILEHSMARGRSGIRLFYRRMGVLVGIGLAHMMLLWSGDILLLYAAMGLLLPLFARLTDRALLGWAAALCLLPVALEAVQAAAGVRFAQPLADLQWRYAVRYGITRPEAADTARGWDDLAVWLQGATSYRQLLQFLVMGAFERMSEFVDGHRALRVLGLFLLGYVVGRRRLYARLGELHRALTRTFRVALGVGLPVSAVYAWSASAGQPWGPVAHSALYTASALTLGGAIASGVALLCRRGGGAVASFFAAPGRMALSCYIGQTLAGIALFYGLGLRLGATLSLAQIELVALGVFAAEALLCRLWLRRFRFGPLEWLWRMLTYGRWLDPRRTAQSS